MNTAQNTIENGTILNSSYMIDGLVGIFDDEITYNVKELSTGREYIMHEYCPADLIVRNTEISDEIKPKQEVFMEYICGMNQFTKRFYTYTDIFQFLFAFFENNTLYIVSIA